MGEATTTSELAWGTSQAGSIPGVSVVICCHNSSKLISETLTCLQVQQRCTDLSWEVIIVDNNSTDKTAAIAATHWEKNPAAPLKIVHEPRIGLSFARTRGVIEARFEIISFIDDDNRVDPDWVTQIPDLFKKHANTAAMGGYIGAEFEGEPPPWFEEFQAYFAVGPQAETEGELDDARGYLCGAGLTVRKEALACLFAEGFRFELVGRQGRQLLCSEDVELCLALKLAGWKLRYQPSLRMRHYMPQKRMNWRYLKHLARGVGFSKAGLIPYYVVRSGQARDARMQWLGTTAKAILGVPLGAFRKLRSLGKRGIGKEDDLEFQRSIGLVAGLWGRRNQFITSIKRMRKLDWTRCSPGVLSTDRLTLPRDY